MITVRTLAVGFAAVLLATFAWAQETNGDDVLERYRLATQALTQANVALETDAVAARSELDRAYSALLTLSRGGSAPLASSLDRVFERARTAIQNRSATDLAVQTSVLRGGFQRMLYEAALASAVEGRDALAASRLEALASDLSLGSARLEQLRAATDVAAMRRVFEAGVAERIEARLNALREAAPPESTDDAYRTLSSTYADFLLVQDSGRLHPTTQERFVAAAEALVAGDDETYANELAAAAERVAALRDAADAGTPADALAQAPTGEAPTAPAETTPAETTPAETSPAETDPAETDPAEPSAEPPADGAPATEDAAEPTDPATADPAAERDALAGFALPADDGEAASELAAGLEEGTITLPMLRARFASEAEAARTAAEVDALATELSAAGVPVAATTALANDLHDAGIRSVPDLERDLAARVARIEAEIQRGRPQATRAQLQRLSEAYDGGLGRIVPRVAPDRDLAYRDLLTRIEDSPSVRPQEASLLATATAELSDALRTPSRSVAHDLATGAHDLWSDWIRAAVMIALGVLALIPLRLLGIAFGGANRNWRLVGAALFLLLTPVFVEALIALGALLAEPLSMPVLAAGTVASVFTSETSQMAWAAVMALAIVLASFGFYGICVQFGVLGRGRAAPAAAKQPEKAPTRDETLVDWDDDY